MDDSTTGSLVCNICGGEEFKPGPNGRLAAGGKLPQCRRCRSLERHRILRRIYERFPGEFLAARDCLQFSQDMAVDPAWFRSHTVSVYGGENHLDLMAIARPSASCGFVVCNHVLEHVPDDRVAFSELLRILAPQGVLQFSTPIYIEQAITRELGAADTADHGHYRYYGADIMERLRTGARHCCRILEVVEVDPVTRLEGRAYLVTRGAAVSREVEGFVSPLIGRRLPPAILPAPEAVYRYPPRAAEAEPPDRGS